MPRGQRREFRTAAQSFHTEAAARVRGLSWGLGRSPRDPVCRGWGSEPAGPVGSWGSFRWAPRPSVGCSGSARTTRRRRRAAARLHPRETSSAREPARSPTLVQRRLDRRRRAADGTWGRPMGDDGGLKEEAWTSSGLGRGVGGPCRRRAGRCPAPTTASGRLRCCRGRLSGGRSRRSGPARRARGSGGRCSGRGPHGGGPLGPGRTCRGLGLGGPGSPPPGAARLRGAGCFLRAAGRAVLGRRRGPGAGGRRLRRSAPARAAGGAGLGLRSVGPFLGLADRRLRTLRRGGRGGPSGSRAGRGDAGRRRSGRRPGAATRGGRLLLLGCRLVGFGTAGSSLRRSSGGRGSIARRRGLGRASPPARRPLCCRRGGLCGRRRGCSGSHRAGGRRSGRGSLFGAAGCRRSGSRRRGSRR